MNRRSFLRAGVVAGAASLAGCSGLLRTQSGFAPPVVENRPDAVYYPSHAEGMAMAGMASAGEYRVALMYSYPHRFWNVNGREVQKTAIEAEDAVHLMASVWDPETGVVVPEAGLSVELAKGDWTSEEVIYPMLSQKMGFHYGANFPLDGDGTYDVAVNVGGVSLRRTGAFEGRFGEPTSATIPFEYTEAKRNEVSYEKFPDEGGKRDAIEPMQMEMVPNAVAPAKDELPGEIVGEGTSGDAVFLATVIRDAPRLADGPYLAVSPRTPYNRMVTPAMGLAATVTRDGETVFDGPLRATLDPTLRYHYGAPVDGLAAGDEVTLSVTMPPQVARHEGYETAFLEMDDVSFTA
ncbi:iron transporter [Halobacteriaceae archaeon GCM10025711]